MSVSLCVKVRRSMHILPVAILNDSPIMILTVVNVDSPRGKDGEFVWMRLMISSIGVDDIVNWGGLYRQLGWTRLL